MSGLFEDHLGGQDTEQVRGRVIGEVREIAGGHSSPRALSGDKPLEDFEQRKDMV